jgi:hypothetical protein
VSALYSRADHVHPTDTSRAPLASPTFTGTVTIPLATMTGALTVSQTAGIVGTTTSNNANAGAVGEVISAVTSVAVTLTTATAANVGSISLTAGDWDVSGEVWFSIGTGLASAAVAGVSQTSATFQTLPALNSARCQMGFSSPVLSAAATLALRPSRVSLASTTTYFLVAQMNFPSGTCTATGVISARRRR